MNTVVDSSKLTTADKDYYAIPRPIGIFVLSNSLKEQYPNSFPFETEKTWLYLINDWVLLLMCIERLKNSIEKNSRWDIALDATSYYLLLRIYFDSFASIIYQLLKLLYPSKSRMWPSGSSFAGQLKWFGNNKIPEYAVFWKAMQELGFDEFFKQERDLRNSLKAPPHLDKSKRMSYMIIPDIQKIRANVGNSFFSTIRFSDFVGDYLLVHISSIKSLRRLEETEYGDPVGLFSKEQLEVYKWFISTK